MSKNARSRLWTRCFSRKPAPELPTAGLRFEQLEDRLAPATFNWTGASGGAGGNSNWSNPNNWLNELGQPQTPTGAVIDLVFPTGAARPANFNDLTNGTLINSITISGLGAGGTPYNLSEAPDPAANGIVLSTSFTLSAGASSATYGISTTLETGRSPSFTVNSGTLTVTGAVASAGSSTLNKDGFGTMVLTGANPNLDGGVSINSGVLEIRHAQALGDADGAGTTVSSASDNAALHLRSVAGGPVLENLLLQFGGAGAQGALRNLAGNTEWAGTVTLQTGNSIYPGGVASAVIGVDDATRLTITGLVTDAAAGTGLVKEGGGELVLARPGGNTYRGTTNVNNGVLTITSALALGNSTIGSGAENSVITGTYVNTSTGGSGQLRLEAPAGSPGFAVVGELLVLNQSGPSGAGLAGALANTRGNNTWAGQVRLGGILNSAADPQTPPTIGVAPDAPGVPSSLAIIDVIDDPHQPNASLTKVGGGRLILTTANTYDGPTLINAGTVTIRDSSALGTPGGPGGTVVSAGAALELDIEKAYQGSIPQFDILGRDTWTDSNGGGPDGLVINEGLTVSGRGVGSVAGTGVAPGLSTGGTGALRSVTGINRWISPINLGGSEVAIGVEPDGSVPGVNGVVTSRAGHPTPDSSYFQSDYSLTVVSTISGGRSIDLVKRGTGHLVLPNDNPYFGRTLIEQGWVTARSGRSLGDSTPNTTFGETAYQPTIVSDGAALHLFSTQPGVQIVLQEDYIVLEGLGVTHPYGFISRKGALMNVGGDNTVTADIGLINTHPGAPTGANPAQGAGIGVERAGVVEFPTGTGNLVLLPSSLILSGDVSDGERHLQSFAYSGPTNQNPERSRVYDVGAISGRITVPYDMGTTADTLRIYYPPRGQPGSQLIWTTGGSVLGVGLATVNFGPGATNQTQIEVVVNEGGGFTTAPIGWSVGVQNIANTPRGVVAQSPGAFVKLGSQTLTLQGAGRQTGALNEVREGTLRLQNETALGRATTGAEATQQTYDVTRTEVANGARLELAGSVAMHQGGVAAGLQVLDERLVLNEYGVQIRVAGQPTSRFRLDFAGQQTRQLQVPATDPMLDYAAYLQTVINQDLTNIAASLVAGIPGAVPADAAARVVQVGPGVFAVTFGAARFNNLDISALTAVISPVGETILPVVDPMNPATVAALAEVRINGTNAPFVSLSDDNTWRGDVDLNRGTRIEVRPNSRLNLLGTIRDAANPAAAGSDLVKRDAGDLTLGGTASSFRGTTWIDEGILTAVSNRAFGDVTGGTIVADGAQLQIQGSLTIAGEALSVEGNGTATLPALDSTIRWLNVGPGATNNGVAPPYSPVGAPTSARINSIATDPTDPRVIYVATAGGGAWKTKDGGLTWIPLFDLAVQSGTNTPVTAPTDATPGGTGLLPLSAMMFGGSIAVAPNNPAVVYYATGDSNATFNGIPQTGQQDNYAGSGVYRSLDFGKTWTRLVNVDGTNPLYGQAVTKIVVDPLQSDRIYVASSTTRTLLFTPNNVPNGSTNPSTRAGVWRFTNANSWVNLTGQTSPARRSTVGQAPYDMAPPNNPGPDDDYRIRFPTGEANSGAEAATWSDVQLVLRGVNPNTGLMQYTLYIALGESNQTYFTGAGGQAIRNAVYRSDNPEVNIPTPASTGPHWWIGPGTYFPIVGIPATIPDARPGPGFPVDSIPPVAGAPGRFGYIKIATASVADEVWSPGGPGSVRVAYANVTLYAGGLWRDFVGTDNSGNLAPQDQLRGELRELLRTVANVTANPAGYTYTGQGVPTTPFGAAVVTNGANGRPATGRYNFTLAVTDYDPRTIADNNPNEVFLGGLDTIFRSLDGAGTWAAVPADDRGFAPAEQHHAIAFDTSNRLLMGTDGGLWRWDRFRFSDLNSNLPVIQFNSVDAHPTDFRQAVGGASDTGTQVWNGNTGDGSAGVWRRVDDASSTTTSGQSGSVSGIVRYDPFNPLTIYAVRDGQLRRSDDGGLSWLLLDNVTTQPPVVLGPTAYTHAYNQFPLAVDPLTPNRIVYGGVQGLFESINRGGSRINLNAPLLPRAIAVAGFQGAFVPDPRFPSVTEGLSNTPDPRTIYVTDGATISVTKNRGVSWAGALANLVVPAGGAIVDLIVNPVNRDEVYAVVTARPGQTGGRVWRSLDAGQSWTNLTGVTDPDTNDPNLGPLPNIPVWKAAIDPRTGDLFVGTDNGVWVLVDPAAANQSNLAATASAGTAYWRRLGDGMPNVQVRDLVINQTTSVLTAGTYGRGMFQMFLPDYAAASGAVRAVSGQSRWTGPVTLTGNTRIGTVGTQQIQNGLSAASLDFGGTVSSPGGAFTLEKVGQGTLLLSGANTYTGQTIVQEGVLEVRNPNALGAATPGGNTVVQYGAALQVRSDIEAEPITINGDGIYFNGHATGALRNLSGNNVYNGVLTLGTGTFLAPPQPTDPVTAQVTIGVDSGSSLRIGQNPTGQNPSLVGRVAGAAASQGIDKELPGILILSSDNTNYLGLTRVISGAVEVRNAEALGPVAGSQGTVVFDGSAVRLANNTPGTPTIVQNEALTLSGTGTPDGPGGSGTGALRNTGGNNTWAGPILLDSVPNFAPTTNPGTQVSFGVTNPLDVLTVSANGGITENAAVGQFGLIKVGTGIMRLEQANLYTGVTNVNEGTLRAANDDALGVVETSSEVQTIRVFGVGSFRLNLNGQLTPVLTADPVTGASAATVAAALERLIAGDSAVVGATTQANVQVTETPNANGRVYTVTFRGRFAGTNIASLLAANVSAGVTVTIDTPQQGGLGTVVAGGASLELDGDGLTVNETLTLNGAGVTEAGGVRYGALGNRGGNNTYGSVGTPTGTAGTGVITIGTATTMGAQPGTTLTVAGRVLGQPNDPTVVPDVVTPAAPELTKVGTGTVVFPNDKEFRGRTTVAEGALRIESAGALGVSRSEIQLVRVTGAFGTTRYTISFLGETTDPIVLQSGAAGATALYDALTQIRAVGATGGDLPPMFGLGDLIVTALTVPAAGAGEPDEALFEVRFTGELANTNVPLLTDVSPATPNSPPPITLPTTTVVQGQPATPIGANEVQTITVPNTGGTFTLNSNLSGPIGGTFPINVSLAALQAALDARYGTTAGIPNALASVRTQPGNNSRLFTITFQQSLANTNVPQITGAFTPEATVRIQTVEDGVGSETQVVDVQGTSGQYTLRYTNPFTGQVVSGTRLLVFNASEAAFRAALLDAPGVGGLGLGGTFGYLGAGDVRVTRTNSQGGFQYLVQFRGALGNVNLLPIQVVPLVGSSVTSNTSSLQDGPEGTVVLAGASLQVRNVATMTSETVTLNGDGLNGAGALQMVDSTGAFTTTWDAPLVLGSTAAIGVDDPADRLVITKATTDRNPYAPATAVLGPTNVRGTNQTFGVNKVGPGTLEYAATGDNDYFGTTTVRDGTLLLNHTGTTATQGAVRGQLVVGDNVPVAPGGQTAVVRLLQNNQIVNTTAAAPSVLVNADGLLDVNGFSETIGTLNVVQGVVSTNDAGTGGALTTAAITIGTATTPGGRVTVENGGALTAGNVDMTGGLFQVGTSGAATATIGTLTERNSATTAVAPNALLTSGAIDLTTSSLSVGAGGTVQTNGATITARQTSTITTGAGATLTTVGATRGAVVLTDSTLNAGPTSQTLTGAFTLNGAVGSTATFGTDSTLNTGGNALTLTNSSLTGTVGVDLLTGAVDLTDSTLNLGNGPSATLNTGGQAVTVTRSTLQTGSGGAVVTAGGLTATGAAGDRSTIAFGDDTTATFAGPVSLTQTDLTGTVGVDIDTQALSLDAATLSLGSGPSARLDTNGQLITLTNASDLAIGPNASLTGGNLTGTGNSTVATGGGSDTDLGAVNLTGGSLTTGIGSTFDSTSVTTNGTTVQFGATSTNNIGNLDVTGGSVLFGANSSTGLTTPGNVTTTGATVTLATDADLDALTLSLVNATLALGTLAVANVTAVNLTNGHATLDIGSSLRATGTITTNADAASSDVTGTGTFVLNGAADQTVSVADGAAVEDFRVSSLIAATGTQNLVKTGAGRLVLAPAGAGFLNDVVVVDGDVQVDTVTADVILARQAGTNPSVSGVGTTGAISGTSPAQGTIAPGDNGAANPAGILTATGDVELGAGSVFLVNLAGTGTATQPTAGVHYDQLRVTGAGNDVILGAGVAVLQLVVDAASIRLGHQFTIIDTTAGGTISGTFAEAPTSPGFVFVGEFKFRITYTSTTVVLEKVKTETSTTLTSANLFSATSGSPSTLNQPVTFTATVTSETGSLIQAATNTAVQFRVDGADFGPLVPVGMDAVETAPGVFSFSMNGLPGVARATFISITGGTHSVVARYLGDADNFNASDSPALTQVVETPAVTLTAPAATPAPISPNNATSVGVNDSIALAASVTEERSAYRHTLEIRNSSNVVVYTVTTPATGFLPATAPANTSTINTSWDGTRNTGGSGFVPDGDYTAVITIVDQWGNTASTTPLTIRADNTSPTSSGTVDEPVIQPGAPNPPADATTFSGTVADVNLAGWTVTVRDSGGGFVRQFSGTTGTVNAVWDGTDAGNVPVAQGTYTLTLVATDTGGNQSPPVTQTVFVITAAPTVTVTSGPAVGSTTNQTTYGEAVTLTALVSIPASVAGAATFLSGRPVQFSFPGTGTLTANLVATADPLVYQASVVVPLNLGAGTYTPVTATFLSTDEFLTNTSAPATHTVIPAQLRVQADNKTRAYGDANPPFTFTVTAADLRFTDTTAVVTGTPTTTATPASNAGTYPITRGSVTAGPNYTVVFTNGTLTVTQVPLTIRVNDALRARFAQNPTFTATFEGLRNGDTGAVVGNLNLVTTATPNSPTGTYPITAAGTPAATNYFPISVVPGTLTVTGTTDVTVIGSGGAPGQALVVQPNGTPISTIPFDPAFAGGIRTASGDFNRDGVTDYVLATGPGRAAQVQVIDGATGGVLFQAFPFEDFTGGAFVAAGDMTGDGVAELVVTPDEGGGPRVVIYRGGDFAPLVSYFAIDDANFRGGVRPAVGDIDNDGFADLAVSAGFGGGPRISLWDGQKLGQLEFVNMIPDFFAFEQQLRNGAFVAIGDVDGDGFGDLMAGAGPGGGPRVKMYSGASLLSVGGPATAPFADFFAGNVQNRGGVKVAAKNLDGDRFIDVVTGGGLGDRAVATAYRGSALAAGGQPVQLFEVDLDGTLNGVFVG